ncbi:MAG: hypothetical protein ABIH92_01050 [Nanoarchaeota archaeon]
MLIREFRASIILCVNVICDDDTPLDKARAMAGQKIDEIRSKLEVETWTNGFPKTVDEIIKEEN